MCYALWSPGSPCLTISKYHKKQKNNVMEVHINEMRGIICKHIPSGYKTGTLKLGKGMTATLDAAYNDDIKSVPVSSPSTPNTPLSSTDDLPDNRCDMQHNDSSILFVI